MADSHKVAMDQAGRLVVPKPLRDVLGAVPGQPLRASVRDGRLELVPEPLEARLVEEDGVLVITPTEPVAGVSSWHPAHQLAVAVVARRAVAIPHVGAHFRVIDPGST